MNPQSAAKDFLKRYVFKLLLKESKDGEALILYGNEFHSFGATEQKARSPNVLSLIRGSLNSSC